MTNGHPTKPKHFPIVYFVRADEYGPIKIGYSATPRQRLSDLQNGSPHQLRLIGYIHPGSYHLERQLHQRFRSLRLHGEWFDPRAPLINFIAQVTVQCSVLLSRLDRNAKPIGSITKDAREAKKAEREAEEKERLSDLYKRWTRRMPIRYRNLRPKYWIKKPRHP
jgi:hypothetical protein